MRPLRRLRVTDIRECDVAWHEDGMRIAITMSGETAYIGDLVLRLGFDFIGRALWLGLVPDRPAEFCIQMQLGLDALIEGRARQLMLAA